MLICVPLFGQADVSLVRCVPVRSIPYWLRLMWYWDMLVRDQRDQRAVAPADCWKGDLWGHMKGFLHLFVRWARFAGTGEVCPALAAQVSPVLYKIFFSSLPTISHHVSPSPSKLGSQPCRVACLLLCVPGRDCRRGRWPEAEFLDENQKKVLRVFLLAIHSHLYSFALRFLFLQTHATSYSFYSSFNVHCKGERRKTW